jgi:hypothetical protein
MVQANADVTGSFETTEFEYSRNSMAGSFDFRALEGRLVKIKEALLEEHSGWIRQGEAATAKGAHSYDCQQIQMALQVVVFCNPEFFCPLVAFLLVLSLCPFLRHLQLRLSWHFTIPPSECRVRGSAWREQTCLE